MATWNEVKGYQEVCFDKLGNPITPGSLIVYGHALDRSAALRIGKVLKVYKVELYMRYEWRIRVRGIKDDWFHEEPKLMNQASTLYFPNRIIVLDPKQVSPQYQQLLEDV